MQECLLPVKFMDHGFFTMTSHNHLLVFQLFGYIFSGWSGYFNPCLRQMEKNRSLTQQLFEYTLNLVKCSGETQFEYVLNFFKLLSKPASCMGYLWEEGAWAEHEDDVGEGMDRIQHHRHHWLRWWYIIQKTTNWIGAGTTTFGILKSDGNECY